MFVCSMLVQYARGSDLWISLVWTVVIISGFTGCAAFVSLPAIFDDDRFRSFIVDL